MKRLSQKPYLSVLEAARHLDIETETVREMIETDQLETRVFFGEPHISRASVLRQIEREN